MLLRIFWLVCLICVTHSGPVTKIEDYSNDLTKTENNEDIYSNDAYDDFERHPKIYDDVANLEVIPKPSILSKRMAARMQTLNANGDDAGNFRHDFMSYVSRNIASELPDVNLTDANDVQKVVGTVIKLYRQYFENRATQGPGENQVGMEMMSDQPMNDDSGFKKIVVPTFDELPTVRNTAVSSSEKPSTVTNRDDALTKEIRMMTKDIYRNAFKQQVLAHINRPDKPVPSFPNLTIPFPKQTIFDGSDSPYTEKIRSFYPTCDIPKNTKEAWKEENLLNLFFNVDYNQNATIATATLRLHRLPRDNQTDAYLNPDICPHNIFEEEKLIRVSIYWYIKPSKKHNKIKRRLCDSKVINENAQWVELSVKAATKTWTKSGKNMGLAILVEDQDGGMLKASKYFKGATCTVGTVGTPTPRPIPTLITDTAKEVNDSSGIFALLGINETGSLSRDFGLLPKIDICVVELPGQMPLAQINKGDCELKNSLNELNLNLFKTHHHIRHQKHLENEHHQQEGSSDGNGYDVRSRIIDKKIIWPKDVLFQKLNNGSIINR